MGILTRIVDEIVPGLAFVLDPRNRHWHRMVAKQNEEFSFEDELRSNYDGLRKDNADADVELWRSRLNQEHERLNRIEDKARSVLGASGLLTSLATLLAGVVRQQGTGGKMLLLALVVLLVYAFILAVFGSNIAMRWYLEPADVAHGYDVLHRTDGSVEKSKLRAALYVTGKDWMVRVSLKKSNAVDAAFRAFRNGLVIFGLVAIRLVTT